MLVRFTELAAPEQDEAEDEPCRGLPACWGNRHRGLERGTADGERLVGWNVALDALPIFLEISRIGAPSARSIASDSHVRSLARNESMLSPSGCLLLRRKRSPSDLRGWFVLGQGALRAGTLPTGSQDPPEGNRMAWRVT